MKKIKAIFFDFDGVLTLNKKWSVHTCRWLAELSWWSYSLIKKAYDTVWLSLLLWASFSQIRETFCDRAEIDLDISVLDSVFLSTPKNMSMFTLVSELKRTWFTVWIITDNPKERFEKVRDAWLLDSYFDSISVSSLLGWTKHDAHIFESTWNEVWVDPEECIFIDNSPKNLIVPKAMWCTVFHHDDEENNIFLLKEFLLSHDVQVTRTLLE